MLRFSTRFWALVLLMLLVAAQAHVWAEAGPARTSGHICQVCVSGVWAIISACPGLEVVVWTLRLEAEPSQAIVMSQRTEASTPRAPPHA